ncbi:N-acetylneuraminate synthase family protein [Gammaproteobacteria bacterium]|jgi:sialic acid synthase SpsE|nr:N-acetylneuraminate synthase family protein [Gammaproteobacteria bacterium]|tara:strand:- start:18 stop:1046 length:1029 start_codon:yes stop_codon:yes gene_type:complete
MKNLKLGSLEVSETSAVIVIAEAAVEHLGSLNVAKRMADEAMSCGVDVIKYQLHIPESEMLEGRINFWGGSLDSILEDNNLSVEDHIELIRYCKEIGIQYLCTPFCPDAVDLLNELGVEFFKTGSGELRNEELFKRIAETLKPVIVSTGMSTEDDIRNTVEYLKALNVDFMMTHCTSIYPSPYDAINLEYIRTLREKFDIHVGHSDHTATIWTALGAVAKGAKVIEKHFTLNKAMRGPDYEVSLEPHEMKMMIEGIRAIEQASGDGVKKILKEEIVVRDWAYHSVVTTDSIKKGDIFTRENIGVKRPGTGIPAADFELILGREALADIKINEQLQNDNFDLS